MQLVQPNKTLGTIPFLGIDDTLYNTGVIETVVLNQLKNKKDSDLTKTVISQIADVRLFNNTSIFLGGHTYRVPESVATFYNLKDKALLVDADYTQ
jgi:hypothetical protein